MPHKQMDIATANVYHISAHICGDVKTKKVKQQVIMLYYGKAIRSTQNTAVNPTVTTHPVFLNRIFDIYRCQHECNLLLANTFKNMDK